MPCLEQEEVQEAQATVWWELVDIQAISEFSQVQANKFMAPLTLLLASGALPAMEDTVTTPLTVDSVTDTAHTTHTVLAMEYMAPVTVSAALVSELAAGEPAASDPVASDPASHNAPRV